MISIEKFPFPHQKSTPKELLVSNYLLNCKIKCVQAAKKHGCNHNTFSSMEVIKIK